MMRQPVPGQADKGSAWLWSSEPICLVSEFVVRLNSRGMAEPDSSACTAPSCAHRSATLGSRRGVSVRRLGWRLKVDCERLNTRQTTLPTRDSGQLAGIPYCGRCSGEIVLRGSAPGVEVASRTCRTCEAESRTRTGKQSVCALHYTLHSLKRLVMSSSAPMPL